MAACDAIGSGGTEMVVSGPSIRCCPPFSLRISGTGTLGETLNY